MSDIESDIEIRSAVMKKNVKQPQSPSEDLINNNKKISTKLMIKDALIELKSRKGVSLQAIKKHLTDKYNVNTDKINYMIKKSIKSGVEDGTIVQVKGIGASGSFKLVDVKEKIKKPKKKKDVDKKPQMKKEAEKSGKEKKVVGMSKKVAAKEVVVKSKTKKKMEVDESKKTSKKVDAKVTKAQKVDKVTKKQMASDKHSGEQVKKSKVKMAKGIKTPSKKKSDMMRRKSIGSIIKPPKMKPKHV